MEQKPRWVDKPQPDPEDVPDRFVDGIDLESPEARAILRAYRMRQWRRASASGANRTRDLIEKGRKFEDLEWRLAEIEVFERKFGLLKKAELEKLEKEDVPKYSLLFKLPHSDSDQ